MQKLKEDANNILNYMASNGLVANETKTVFMILNMNSQEKLKKEFEHIQIGKDLVKRSDSTKLLGIKLDDNQKWSTHIDGLIGDLNKRTFTIRRISNQIPQNKVINVVHSLWMSKLRYGLQLCNKVRMTQVEASCQNMKAVQLSQNKMIRMLDRVSLKEHITTESILNKYNLPSVNQLAGEIKLTEAWKIMHVPDYPLKFLNNNPNRIPTERSVRTTTTKNWKDVAKLKCAQESFTIDTARLWNRAPLAITNATSLQTAKNCIKRHCKEMPI